MASAERLTRGQAPAFPDDPEKRREQWRIALARAEKTREAILARRGGVAITEAELQAATEEADDH
jgi:hypothetical protein